MDGDCGMLNEECEIGSARSHSAVDAALCRRIPQGAVDFMEMRWQAKRDTAFTARGAPSLWWSLNRSAAGREDKDDT